MSYFQTQKLTCIRLKVEAVIPDAPVEPIDKIAMDIFGPLLLTRKGNEYTYIWNIQDMLTKYLILIRVKKYRQNR